MKATRTFFLAATLALAAPAFADSTGSAGCAAVTQAASNAAQARVAADDKDIAQPNTVKNLTCLDKFFSGSGLNVVMNLLNPTQLLQSIQTQLCTKLTQVWQSALGSKQCGITLTGLNLGFLNAGSLGSGLSCPKLSFGGGGPPIAQIGVGSGNSGKLYMSGKAVAPTGYPITSLLGLY